MTLAEATAILTDLDAIDAPGLYRPPEHPDEASLVSWLPSADPAEVLLFDYAFTVDELEAIVVWIRFHTEPLMGRR